MTLAGPVTLRPIAFDNFEDVIELQLHPEQMRNLPSNVYSIAESTLAFGFKETGFRDDGDVIAELQLHAP